MIVALERAVVACARVKKPTPGSNLPRSPTDRALSTGKRGICSARPQCDLSSPSCSPCWCAPRTRSGGGDLRRRARIFTCLDRRCRLAQRARLSDFARDPRSFAVWQASASAFMVSPAAARPASAVRAVPATMGPAKDGPFTPLVQLGRVVLGDKLLSKIRGKGISCARRTRCDQTGLGLARARAAAVGPFLSIAACGCRRAFRHDEISRAATCWPALHRLHTRLDCMLALAHPATSATVPVRAQTTARRSTSSVPTSACRRRSTRPSSRRPRLSAATSASSRKAHARPQGMGARPRRTGCAAARGAVLRRRRRLTSRFVWRHCGRIGGVCPLRLPYHRHGQSATRELCKQSNVKRDSLGRPQKDL